MVKMSPVAMNMHPEAMNFFAASELLNEIAYAKLFSASPYGFFELG